MDKPRMFGFVLLPDLPTLKHIVSLNKSFSESPLQLDENLTLPHCTVLQAPIREDFKYEAFLAEFRDYAGFNWEPQTRIGALTQSGHAILLDVENAKWLSTFNQLMVNKVAEFINVPPVTDDMVFANDVQLTSYELTGYKRNLEAYEPHFTVAISDEPFALLQVDNILERRIVRFRKLAFCEHGEFGQIIKILAVKDLPIEWD